MEHKIWLWKPYREIIKAKNQKRRADLSGANLIGANLIGANLIGANLIGADLIGADLRRANLSDADLSGANLIGANLIGANLSGADLSGANLSDANLIGANLSDADLSGANLSDADLSGANLSGSQGILSANAWLKKNFKKDRKGFIVYKQFGDTQYRAPSSWKIEPGAFVEEVCNPCPTCDCACGVNFSTLEWCQKNYTSADLWKCRIRFEDLVGVVVPYHTDGKARCERLELIEKVSP